MKKYLYGILAVCIITLVSGTCDAQIIFVCANKDSGQLRIVAYSGSCRAHEKELSLLSGNISLKGCDSTESENPYNCSCAGVKDIPLSGGAFCSTGSTLQASYASAWPWGGTWSALCADRQTGDPVAPQFVYVLCVAP